MTYDEREALKEFARKGINLEETIIMIAHWHRQDVRVSFTDYAANWAAAESRTDVTAMRKQWPLIGKRHIADNYSDWHSKSIASSKS